MKVFLTLEGEPNENGILGGIDFGDLKKLFRYYIDLEWDHQLHLNREDQVAQDFTSLPGLVVHEGDPTVENIALEIAEHMREAIWQLLGYEKELTITVWETETNSIEVTV